MRDQFEHWKKEVEAGMDVAAIWNDEYMAVLAEEVAEEIRQQARKQAEADIRKRRARQGISR